MLTLPFAPSIDLTDDIKFDRTFLALGAFRRLGRNDKPEAPMSRDMSAMIFMYVEIFLTEGWQRKSDADLDTDIERLKTEWRDFFKAQSDALSPKRSAYIDERGEAKVKITPKAYRPGSSFPVDLRSHLRSKLGEAAKSPDCGGTTSYAAL
jgi:hypothetical protein